MRARSGMTLVEIIVAAVLTALVAGGTMIAFVTAAKMSRRGGSSQAEAAFYAQQTVEKFRNKVACRQPSESAPQTDPQNPAGDTWFNASCQSDAPTGWQEDALPTGAAPSITGLGAQREYEVVPGGDDFDNDGRPDYYRVTSKVTWTTGQ